MAEDTKIRGRKQAKGSKNIRSKLTELVRSKRQSGRQDNAENTTRQRLLVTLNTIRRLFYE